ncbi:hypothetical protein [Marinomonas vulgaris]|uniref:hypothetical protein n=1 Tax=Marinomonas vulgaris TaxID=2823372 RepID=UPI001F4076A0|nr:hypothetical protein [Marinomonas vulgaris]
MDTAQRYWMLELIAFWEGQINTKPLMTALGLTRQSVSHLLTQYQADYPNALTYDATQKAYQVTDDFAPQFIDQTVDEYFSWLNFGRIPTFFQEPTQRSQYCINPLPRFVSPQVMRPLLKA